MSGSECPTIELVVFEQNVSEREGGGMRAYCDAGVVRGATFLRNRSLEGGGGLFNGGSLIVVDSRFSGNEGEGAGIYSAEQTHLLVVNSVIAGNHGGWGGGLSLEESENTALVNSLVTFNTAIRGAGLYSLFSNARVLNSVVAYNLASDRGAAIAARSDATHSIAIENTIVWNNTAESIDAPFDFDTTHGYIYSFIEMGTSILQDPPQSFVRDDGNTIDSDPMFVDPLGVDGMGGTIDDDFRLRSGSPAIDAGNNTNVPADSLDLDNDLIVTEPIPIDLDGNVRIFDGGSGTMRVDIGPYEYGAPPVALSVATPAVPQSDNVEVFPVPANDYIEWKSTSRLQTIVRVEVFDLLGRLLLSTPCSATEGRIELGSGRFPSGLYLLVATTSSTHRLRSSFVVRQQE